MAVLRGRQPIVFLKKTGQSELTWQRKGQALQPRSAADGGPVAAAAPGEPATVADPAP